MSETILNNGDRTVNKTAKNAYGHGDNKLILKILEKILNIL